jgi:FAD:protein FMN transferase
MRKTQSAMATEAANLKTFNRRQLLSFRQTVQFDGGANPAADRWLAISRVAMACRFEVIIDSLGRQGIDAAGKCLDEVDRLESILSIFRPTSEVSRLNREASTSPVLVGSELLELLQICKRLHEESEGAFDITTGALSECWGFQERNPKLPATEILTSARERVGAHLISFGTDGSVSLRRAGIRINLGGVGKGYALDRGAAKISERGIGTALLNAGGSSILALGAGPEGTGWRIGLRHPVFREKRMATVRLRSCAMGTSSQEEQSFEESGRRYGHILDPQTGFPPTRVRSVSVIADSAARADALATAFFVGGPELAARFCSKHEGVTAVMLLANDLTHPIVFGSCDRAVVEIMNE